MTRPLASQTTARAISFLFALLALGLVWLVVLPLVARHSHVADHIERQESLEIDPSAMFYSELKIVPAIAHKVERRNVLALTLGRDPAASSNDAK